MFAGLLRRKQTPFRCGDAVVVKPWSEILATLDEQGTCEGLPFMPEMLPYCGREARVVRRVEHVFLDHLGYVARLEHTVILDELRCSGARHDGCQMGCQLLWKEQWLRSAADVSDCGTNAETPPDAAAPPDTAAPPDAADLLPTQRDGKLWCQATQLPLITRRMPSWDVRQYWRGLRARNLGLVDLSKMAGLLVVNRVRWWCGKEPLGMLSGPRRKTVHESLNLEPGELVEVKTREEIQATLDVHGKHRGMAFVPEMALYCGRQFRVARRIERMIEEGTGQMRQLRDTVALESVLCMGLAQRRCPRGCFHLWRENWLKRVPEQSRVDSKPPLVALPILSESPMAMADAVAD